MHHGSCRIFTGVMLAGTFLFANLVQAQASEGTGIEGRISVSPSRPGPLREDVPSSAPVANMKFIVKKGDTQVASFTTDSEGRFRISLPAGEYTVLREDAGAGLGHWNFQVKVAEGHL